MQKSLLSSVFGNRAKRRSLVRLLAGGVVPVLSVSADEPIPPNFLIILADDLGWQDVKAYDIDTPSPYETPTLDALAEEGVLFTQAYAAAPTCSPARAGLLSGKHPARINMTTVLGGAAPKPHRVDSWQMIEPFYSGRMEVDEVTLADALEPYGYFSGHIGKWHVAVHHHSYPQPLDQGFDWTRNHLGVSRRMEDRTTGFATGDPDDPYRLDENGFAFDQTTQDAIDFLQEAVERGQPFFCYHATWLVHTPIQTRTRRLLEKYCDKLGVSFPETDEPITTPGQNNPYYAAMVEEFDYGVHRILTYLRETEDPRRPGHKLIENTYVFITSDNGGVENSGPEQITDNAPLYKGKKWTHEGGVRVPFIAAGPGIPQGIRSDVMINGLDFFPTLLSLAGAGVPEGLDLDGCDLADLLLSDPTDSERVVDGAGTVRDTMYWHFPHGHAMHAAIRMGDWKLLKNFNWRDNDARNEYELYRMYIDGERNDIEEAVDLASTEPGMKEELKIRLHDWFTQVDASMPHTNPKYDGPLTNKEKVPAVLDAGDGSGIAWVEFETGGGVADVVRADLIYTLNGGAGNDEEWFRLEAELDAAAGRAEARVPLGTTHYLFNLIDENDFLISSVDVGEKVDGLKDSEKVPAYIPTGPPGQNATYSRGADGNWSSLDQWRDNASGSWGPSTQLPGMSDTVVLNNNRVLTLDTDAWIQTLRMVNNEMDAELRIDHPRSLRIGQAMTIGHATQSGTAVYTQSDGFVGTSQLTIHPLGSVSVSGGTLEVGETLTVDGSIVVDGGTVRATVADVGAGFGGTSQVSVSSGKLELVGGSATDVIQIDTPLFEISGGTVNLTGQVRLGNGAELRVNGRDAAIQMLRLNQQGANTGALRFVLGSDGVTPLQVNGWVHLATATIHVDGSAYQGAAGTFTLISGSQLSSLADVENITVTGFDSFEGAYVTQDASSGTVALTVLPPAPASYPPFSWDTVPVYIHFGKTPAVLTDEEVALVARLSDFVCLEKAHARTQFGATEPGVTHDTARLKAANPDMKVLYYWNTFLNYPFYLAGAEVAENPDWILRDGEGNPVYKDGTVNLEQYNILNTSFRQWWASEAGKGTSDYLADGMFADALMQPLRSIWAPYWVPATSEDLIAATTDQLVRARAAMGPEALVIINGAKKEEFVAQADGVMIEHFGAFSSADKEHIAADMETIERLGQQGKIVIVKGWPGPDFNWLNTEKMQQPYEELVEEAREKITFALACYLVAAQPYSYFCYSWGYREHHGSLVDYLEFHLPLGEPLGPAVRNGWIYTRSFEHLDVEVDLEHRTASITADVSVAWLNQWVRFHGADPIPGPVSEQGGAVQAYLSSYAFGGEPDLPVSRDLLPFLQREGEGTEWMEYVYRRRRDAAERGLSYTVTLSDRLPDAQWDADAVEETGEAFLDPEFESVTNRFAVTEKGFVRLKIELQ